MTESDARTLTIEGPAHSGGNRLDEVVDRAARYLAQHQASPQVVKVARVHRAKKSGKPASRASMKQHRELIRDAALRSQGNTLQFCQYMHETGIPPDPAWRVRSWLQAAAQPRLQSAIRALKSRYLKPAV